MKDILQNWNSYTGKAKLTESQKNKLHVKHQALSNNGSLDLIFESGFDNMFESVAKWQQFYEDGCQILGKKAVSEVLNYRICLESLKEARKKDKKHTPMNKPSQQIARMYGLPDIQQSQTEPGALESTVEYFERVLKMDLSPEEREGLEDLMLAIDNEEEEKSQEEESEEEDSFDPFSNLKARAIDKQEVPGFYDSPTEVCYLQLSDENSKLESLDIVSMSLPVGYTCKYAGSCKTFVEPLGRDEKGDFTTKLRTTPKTITHCFMGAIEQRSPEYRAKVWYNAYLLKVPSAVRYMNKGLLDAVAADPADISMEELIIRSIKNYMEQKAKKIKLFRIHAGGDFFSQEYFDAWLGAVRHFKNIIFYAYTTSLPYWSARVNDIPPNLRLVASAETASKRAYRESIKSAIDSFRKVYIKDTPRSAAEARLQIDVNDFEAVLGEGDFALLLHGARQEAGKTVEISSSFKNPDGTRDSMKVNASTLAKFNSKLIKLKAKQFQTDPEIAEQQMRDILIATAKWHEERMAPPAPKDEEDDK
jgi:hypothetical protein